MAKSPNQIEEKIAGIKKQLLEIGEMRPGSLTYQYRKPKEKEGGCVLPDKLHAQNAEQIGIRLPRIRERPTQPNNGLQEL